MSSNRERTDFIVDLGKGIEGSDPSFVYSILVGACPHGWLGSFALPTSNHQTNFSYPPEKVRNGGNRLLINSHTSECKKKETTHSIRTEEIVITEETKNDAYTIANSTVIKLEEKFS